MKNKILILTNNSGGLYRFRKELISSLISSNIEVIASTPFDNNVEDLKQLGIKLIEIDINRRGMNPIKDSKLILDYFRLIKKEKPSLIITYTIKPNLYGTLIARFLKIPYAINITGLGSVFQNDNWLRKMIIGWYKFVCKKVKVIFFENEGNKQTFLDFNIVEENKTCVLNGAGVNLHDFYFSEYPDSDDKIHFLFIGRIMKEKGVDELFWAIEKIHKQNKNVVLDILGSYEDNYQSKIDNLVENGIVNYYGVQNDVRPFIKKSHCFVLPSYHEGMANTLLENAAMGRPLITSNIFGCKEAVIDKKNGYLIEVKNKDDLYDKMQTFIHLPLEEKQKMGKFSRKHIEDIFDKEKVVKKTIKYLY
ncbi:MAG: glycosyltransferase family 4 protein [Clostridium sp.]